METTKRNLTRDEKLSLQQDNLLEQKGRQIEAANGNESAMPTVKGNRDKSGKYRVLQLEEGYVHVKTIVKHLDQTQKNFVNEETIHKIHAREFDRRVREGAFKTYDEAEVLHDPRTNAPKAYSLKGDFAEVSTQAPQDANVPVKSTTKIQPAGKPGEESKLTPAQQKALDDKGAKQGLNDDDDLPSLGDANPGANPGNGKPKP